MRDRGLKLDTEQIQQITRDFRNNHRDSWGTNADDDYVDEVIYDPNGQVTEIPPDEFKKTTPFVPEMSTEQITSKAEKKAWIDRVKAMTDKERAIALKAFSDEELLSEMQSRLTRASNYIQKMKAVLEDGDE